MTSNLKKILASLIDETEAKKQADLISECVAECEVIETKVKEQKEKYSDLQKDYILLTKKQTFTATENENEDEEKSPELEDIINEVIGGRSK